MAPGDKKIEKPAGWDLNGVEIFVLIVIFMGVITTVVPTIWRYLFSGELSFFGIRLGGMINFFKSNVQLFKTIGYVLGGAGALGTFIFTKKTDAVWREMKAAVFPENMVPSTSSPDALPTVNPLTEKWRKIVEKSESENASDWRLCIIEADIMLDDLLTTLHLPGDTMGEKLKAVEKSDFNTIEYAWEAHKARNMIAHEGQNFLLNQRETRRIISLYGAVFKEFFLI